MRIITAIPYDLGLDRPREAAADPALGNKYQAVFLPFMAALTFLWKGNPHVVYPLLLRRGARPRTLAKNRPIRPQRRAHLVDRGEGEASQGRAPAQAGGPAQAGPGEEEGVGVDPPG